MARQEADCREIAGRRGLAVAAVYVDNDVSASSRRPRPEYLRLVKDVSNGAYSAVLVWHTDRLTRSPLELEGWITAAETGGGVPVHSVVAGVLDLSTPSGRLVARQLAAVARYEVEMKGDRQRAQARQAAEQGRLRVSGSRPYGYDRRPHLDERGERRMRLTVNDAEALVLRECAERILDGEPLSRVAADLNRRCISAAQGGAWFAQSLKRMLCSGFLSGQREHQPRARSETKRVIVGPIVAPGDGSWEPILTPEQTAGLRGTLMDPARRLTRPHPRRGLLTGILRCGICGAGMCIRPTGEGIPRYVCPNPPGSSNCGRIFIIAEWADVHVTGLVLAALASLDLTAKGSAVSSPEGESLLREQVTATEGMLAELALQRFVETGARQLTQVEYDAARGPLAARLGEGRAALAALRPRRLPRAVREGVADRWPHLTLHERRDVITVAVDAVVVGPGRRGYNRFDAGRLDVRWAA